jgi:protocatechuate 3,4-dioxygenase, alpha subunit
MEMIPIPSQTAGPFFHLGLTVTRAVPCIAEAGAKGERVSLTCRLLDGDGSPVNDAMIEVWHADAGGKYNHPDDTQEESADANWVGFGRLGTAEDGSCKFETIKPGSVPGPGNTMQAPHLTLAIFARGMLKQLYTRVYFAGDSANSDDPILALVPPPRRETLLAQPDGAGSGRWQFDIHLQGDRETVFFDV